MSHIHDALKKAQAEGNGGQVADPISLSIGAAHLNPGCSNLALLRQRLSRPARLSFLAD
jgi:hypothetical protein